MRFTDDYEERFRNELHLQEHNREQALRGKKGKQVLVILLNILKAMPEGERKLGWGFLEANGQVCLVGAYTKATKPEVHQQYVIREEINEENIWEYEDDGEQYLNTIDAAKKCGLSRSLAEALSIRNDHYWENCTPEERWQRAVNWIEKELASG